MKKIGFTLAEILITLSIIGVVAALTAPSLVKNTSAAKIGPKLAKASSMLELANQNMLNQMNVDTLTAAGAFQGSSGNGNIDYINNLSNYMKISYFDQSAKTEEYKDLLKDYTGSEFGVGAPDAYITMATAAIENLGLSSDGFLYGFGTGIANESPNGTPAYRQLEGLALIDINGFAEPNRVGRDAFFFAMYKDGSLRPMGANGWSVQDELNTSHNWETGTADKCNATEVTSGWTCAGAIFENNQKVIYQ